MVETTTDDNNQRPLCVDLDGTLVRTDLLYESTFALVKQNPFDFFRLPMWLLKGKAHLKDQIARRTTVDASVLPYNEDFLAFLREQRSNGRQLVLATASHMKYAQAVANHLELFDDIIATDSMVNVSGTEKVARLVEKFGENGFDYAGNSRVDKTVWKHANKAIIVNPSRGLRRSMPDDIRVSKEFDDRVSQIPAYLRAIRPHQWLKNLLLFVPLIMSHRIDEPELLVHVLLAFIAFSFCASSVYLINDLLDLQADRHHPTKCNRPLAAGSISIVGGVFAIPLLLVLSALVATSLPVQYQLTLLVYFAITLSYSVALKSYALIDVLLLAGLYTVRIIAGATAVQVEPSFWLLAFSMFLFLSLALVKRFTELLELSGINEIKGRGYSTVDLETLAQFGTASSYVAVLVLALYIDGETVQGMYQYPKVLWAICPIMLYLVSRVWLLARRGSIHEDPVVFLMRDRRSQQMIALGVLALFIAS